VNTETQNKFSVALQSDSIRVGPGRDGRESGGRKRPAADGRAGPFQPERTLFFPSLSVLRTSFHYRKNGTILSGIGTDLPARRRPAALDRGAGACEAEGDGVGQHGIDESCENAGANQTAE
jgi:hypothetical protein